MKTAGGEPDQNISRHDRLGIENFLPFDDADDKTCQIIFPVGKIAGMLSGLTPDQCTPRLTTPRNNSPHNRLGDIDIKLAADKVVQEEKRLGAMSDDIIHTHRYKIDADAIVLLHHERHFELGPDAIGGRNQHRMTIASTLEIEERAKSADAGEHSRALGSGRDATDAPYQFIAGFDTDAGFGVGHVSRGCH